MKRIICGVLCLIIIAVMPVTVAEDYDFKSFNWGDKMEDVINVLGDPDAKDSMNEINSTVLGYDTNVLGIDVLMMLYFYENQLCSAQYYVSDNYEDFTEVTTCYETFKAALTEKYGEPASDTVEPHGSDSSRQLIDTMAALFEDSYGYNVGALKEGFYTYHTVYDLEKTTITAFMGTQEEAGVQGNVLVTIDYESKEFFPEVNYLDDI